jgi:hypothetical protein
MQRTALRAGADAERSVSKDEDIKITRASTKATENQ